MLREKEQGVGSLYLFEGLNRSFDKGLRFRVSDEMNDYLGIGFGPKRPALRL